MFTFELVCGNCGWRKTGGSAEAAAQIRLVGMLRREKEPEEALLAELLPAAAADMTCPVCKEKKVVATPPGDLPVPDDDWDDWQAARLCEFCRQPIPPERVEALPDVRRCVDCQQRAEAGTLEAEEPEFCPKCGALVELRVSRGAGLTRYKRFCTGVPPCRLA